MSVAYIKTSRQDKNKSIDMVTKAEYNSLAKQVRELQKAFCELYELVQELEETPAIEKLYAKEKRD